MSNKFFSFLLFSSSRVYMYTGTYKLHWMSFVHKLHQRWKNTVVGSFSKMGLLRSLSQSPLWTVLPVEGLTGHEHTPSSSLEVWCLFAYHSWESSHRTRSPKTRGGLLCLMGLTWSWGPRCPCTPLLSLPTSHETRPPSVFSSFLLRRKDEAFSAVCSESLKHGVPGQSLQGSSIVLKAGGTHQGTQ